MSGHKQRKLGETAKHKFEAIYNTLSSMNLQNCPSAAKFFLELTDMLRYGTSDGKPLAKPERPAGPDGHAGDCTIYAEPDGDPTSGVCICGYGLRLMRQGDYSQLDSFNRSAPESNEPEPPKPSKPVDLPPPPPARKDDRIDALARRIEAVESWINAAEPC